MRIETRRRLAQTRLLRPEAIAEAAAARTPAKSPLGEHGKAMIVAADHPARGALRAGGRSSAMADRAEMLERLCAALERPGVTGVLGSADVLEDLLLSGALDGKTVFGSMNRGGLAGASFEVDDRFTGMDSAAISRMGFEGGKMLLRVDFDDDSTAAALESCARAVSALAETGSVAMVEPFLSRRVDGRLVNDLSPDAVATSIAVASGLGATSAYTWLKVPVVDDFSRVVAASTLPTLLLGGEVGADPDAQRAGWADCLREPNVYGLVVGRSLLYPSDDDVAAAVDAAVKLL
ncbi:MAG: Cgl0159 family (beta/alpha)8-fold protein [Stackebrandtia sp.]